MKKKSLKCHINSDSTKMSNEGKKLFFTWAIRTALVALSLKNAVKELQLMTNDSGKSFRAIFSRLFSTIIFPKNGSDSLLQRWIKLDFHVEYTFNRWNDRELWMLILDVTVSNFK